VMKKRLEMKRRKYPEVRGKIVDYISHSIDDGTLCMNVCFKDKTIFSLRFACEIFIVGADISDWKTGNYDIIREYMKPIPVVAGELTSDALRSCRHCCAWPDANGSIFSAAARIAAPP